MKITLAIPSVEIPRLSPVRVPAAARMPKVRIPFLSLLLEPRPLKKWIYMWSFCLYLVACMACFFAFEQPRLNHETYIRFGADSPTYWEAVEYRGEHRENVSLVTFTGNLLGPVSLGLLLKSGFAVACFNIFLFFIAIEIACTIPGMDRYRLILLLFLAAETPPALVTLNKEIFVLFSTLLLCKYIYSQRKSWTLLAIVLVASLFARWEQIAIILIFLFLRRKGSFFRRHPRIAISSVIAVLTVAYGLVARIPHSGLGAFTQYANGANTIVKLNAIQAHFGFPLVLIPKIILDLMGELLRPWRFIGEIALFGIGDLHSTIIIPFFSIALIVLLVMAYRRGMLNPHRPIAMLMTIYIIMNAMTPFVQPRYNYFVYVLLCVELSRKEDGDEERTSASLSAPVIA